MPDLERPPSRLPGVRFGAIARHGDSRGAFRELWRASAFPTLDADRDRRAGRERAAVRPGQPVDVGARASCAGSTTTAASSTTGSSRAGRAFVALVDVRPLSTAASGRPLVETRELVADDWVVIPTGVAHGFLALEQPGAPLSRHERVRRQRRARLRLGRSEPRPCPGRRSPARRTAARSCRIATAPTRRLVELVASLRP